MKNKLEWECCQCVKKGMDRERDDCCHFVFPGIESSNQGSRGGGDGKYFFFGVWNIFLIFHPPQTKMNFVIYRKNI